MNPILALGQIIVSIALIAAILLQARGPACRAPSVATRLSIAAAVGSNGGCGSSRSSCSSCSSSSPWRRTSCRPRPAPDVAPRRSSRGHHTELHDPDRHRHRRDARRPCSRSSRVSSASRPSSSPRRRRPRPHRRARTALVSRSGRTSKGVVGAPSSVSPLTAEPRPIATWSRCSSPDSCATGRAGRSCPTSPSGGRWTRRARRGRSTCARTRAGTTARRSPPTTWSSRSRPCRTRPTRDRPPPRGPRSPSRRPAPARCGSRSRPRSVGSCRP